MKMKKKVLAIVGAAAMLAAPMLFWAAGPALSDAAVVPVIKLLLQTTTTVDGTPLAYQTGKPQITVRDITFPPGAEIPRHRHSTPLFAYILEGELVVAVEGEAPQRYKAGDALMETAGWHVGRNDTDKPARLLAVYIGATDQPLAIVP